MFGKLIYQLSYRLGQIPWDAAQMPPELVSTLQSAAPDIVLDVGCGTGNHSIYAAQQGATVIGIDFVESAIQTAQQKAQAVGVTIDFRYGDATQLDTLNLPLIDMVLDIKCTHGLSVAAREQYVYGLTSCLRPDGLVLMEALSPRSELGFRFGLQQQEVEDMMSPHFKIARLKENGESTWYWLERS